MNFYERAKKLRDKYFEELQSASTRNRADAKLQLLSILVSTAFYTNPISSKKNPDELPSIFHIDGSNLHFCIDYYKSFLEDVLKDLGYDNFSIKINHWPFNQLDIEVDLNKI